MKKIRINKKGLSIIETLVVVTIFAILAAVASQSIALSLRGARKSDSLANVRDELDFIMSSLERNVRGARAINSVCNGGTLTTLSYENEDELTSTVSCTRVGSNRYIELNGERLNSSDLAITSCLITCEQPTTSAPPVVSISLSGQNKNVASTELSNVSVETQIRLRVY